MSTTTKNDNLSLDDLFENLQNEMATLQDTQIPKEEVTEFDKIKESLKKLPKLTSSIDSKSYKIEENDSTARLVKNDPIVVKAKVEKDQDAGKDWFNMPKIEITKEVKNDLLVISKRDVLDPKRHYKKQKWVQPKFFQIGEIINDNYSKNMTRRQKGTSLINELLVDDDTKKYFKRRYNEIQETKTSGKLKDYKKQQKMRRKF